MTSDYVRFYMPGLSDMSMIGDGYLPLPFWRPDGTESEHWCRDARLLRVEDESRYSVVSIALGADEASLVVEILLRLAALIDSDDPDGLRTASGQRSSVLEAQMLTDTQFALLRNPLYMASQRANVATRLRIVSAKIEGQLPDDAPDIMR